MRKKRVLLLSVHHPELVRGGAQQICYELFEGLKNDEMWEPTLLASVDQSYPALFKTGARIRGFDRRQNEFLYLVSDYDYWWHKTSELDLIAAFKSFLIALSPEVVHFHHFLSLGIDLISLTRSILPTSKIVFTFHEFMSICAADGHMVRRTDRSLCGHASPVRCHQCFPERTPEDFFLRELWFKMHFSRVDIFTCPAQFMIQHYIKWGLDKNKIRYVPNGQRRYGAPVPNKIVTRNRFGYFGQLVDVKGVHILLRAVQYLRLSGFTDFSVEINGGNLRYASPSVQEEIEVFLDAERQLSSDKQIVFENGEYQIDELPRRMARIDWCIVPSLWWEVFGLVVSEAWMFGRPVICSNAPGLSERVVDNVSGLLFDMGDFRSLADTIRRACTERDLWELLVTNMPQPPQREMMVEAFREIYSTDRHRDV